MKKLLILMSAALIAVSAPLVTAMTADELIAKHIEATGGMEKIKSVQSMKLSGKILMGAMEFPFNLTQTRDHKMRIDSDIQGMAFVQCYDGETAWTINPMTGSQEPQDLPEAAQKVFKHSSDIDGLVVDYKKKGYTAEYIGEDEVEGTAVHHLKLDTADDIVYDMYYDTDYFMLIKQTRKLTVDDTEHTQDQFFSDYKEVDGMMVPHAIEERGQGGNQIMVDTVEFNVKVDDAMFKKPETEAEPAEEKPEE